MQQDIQLTLGSRLEFDDDLKEEMVQLINNLRV